jgi:serine/threonine-protein kinase
MSTALPAGRPLGPCTVFGEIARGGMATVHYGYAGGSPEFGRVVAIKRLLPEFAGDPEFASMFLNEARLAARVRHLNVVTTYDVVQEGADVGLVMEYVHGETLMRLLRKAGELGRPVPVEVVAALGVGMLLGLHAAHEARGLDGAPLAIVHRDLSPHNVMVGSDGVVRVLDFGVAKAAQQCNATRAGLVKGKLAYAAPEQVQRGVLDRRGDVYSAAVCLWEALTLRRLHYGKTQGEVIEKVAASRAEPPSRYRSDVPAAFEAVILAGLRPDREARPATAREMAQLIEAAVDVAPLHRVARWVEELAGETLVARAAVVEAIERGGAAARGPAPPAPAPIAPAQRLASGMSFDGGYSVGAFLPRAAEARAPSRARRAAGGALLVAGFALAWWGGWRRGMAAAAASSQATLAASELGPSAARAGVAGVATAARPPARAAEGATGPRAEASAEGTRCPPSAPAPARQAAPATD